MTTICIKPFIVWNKLNLHSQIKFYIFICLVLYYEIKLIKLISVLREKQKKKCISHLQRISFWSCWTKTKNIKWKLFTIALELFFKLLLTYIVLLFTIFHTVFVINLCKDDCIIYNTNIKYILAQDGSVNFFRSKNWVSLQRQPTRIKALLPLLPQPKPNVTAPAH